MIIMMSFLINVDRAGTITSIYWSEPAHIFPPHSSSFTGFFRDMDQGAFSAMTEQAEKGYYRCPREFHLKDLGATVHMGIMKAEEACIVVGLGEDILGELSDAARDLIRRYTRVVAECSKENFILSTKTSRIQFEKLQSLNNELVNTKRMLEKTNALLQAANQDLNNRLVKDALTGLVSRYQYRTEIEESIARHPGKFGMFTFIDLDSFKLINDTYGHGVGDQYLIEFAQRLKKLPAHTVKIRISGDEFGLFTCGLERGDSDQAQEIWDQIQRHVVHKPITINGQELPLAVSAGMAVYGIDTVDIYEMIEFADFAMYEAKRSGKNQYRVFDRARYEQKQAARK